MKEQILEIIQKNYNKFTGTNEAELHSAEEIEEMLLLFVKWKDDNYVMLHTLHKNNYVSKAIHKEPMSIKLMIELYGKNINQLFAEFKKFNP